MGEDNLDKKIIQLLTRLRFLKEKFEELIQIGDTTIEDSALSQLDDFEASIYYFQEIASKVDDSYNFDKEYAIQIVINAGKFCSNVRATKTIRRGSTFEVLSVLQACKDNIDKMIETLKPNEDDLFSQLEKCRDEVAHLREECELLTRTKENLEHQINALTGEDVMVNTSRELAKQLIRKHFIEPMRKQRRENMENILTFLIDNKNKELDTKTIKSSIDVKSKETIRTICKALANKGIIGRSRKTDADYWIYKDG